MGTGANVENSSENPVEKRKEWEKERKEIFGVQLEVTSLLLEAERRRLCMLQTELANSLFPNNNNHSGSSFKAKEETHKELVQAISRIQLQYEQLEQEYKIHALGALRRCNTGKNKRSQPAIGLNIATRYRPTIFGTVADENGPEAGKRTSLTPGGKISCSASNQPKYAVVSSSGSSNETPSPVLLNGSVYSDGGSSSQDSSSNPSDKEQGLVYQHGGNLVAGSLDALVRHLIPTPDYYPERTYIFAFLLSSRLFIKPHVLLGEVCKMCLLHQNLADLHVTKEKYREKVCPNVIRLLSEWAELFPYDFRDERMMTHVREIAQSDCVAKSDARRKEISLVLHNLLHKLSSLEKYEEFLHKINTELKPRTFDQVPTSDITMICPSPVNLAKQLTRIELERLSYIGPEEFVQAFAKEAPNLETSFKDMKKTKNLESYIQWFNRLSFFVATEVVLNTKKKARVKMIEYWIEVARECFNLGNFNSLMAIIAGLNMSPVARLKKTWSKVPTSKLSILEQQMSPSSNFTSYRSTLAAAQWRSQTQSASPVNEALSHHGNIRRSGPASSSSSTSSSSSSSHSSVAGSPHAGATSNSSRPDTDEGRRRIIIPFFSLLVKDLYFLNEGCASRSPSGLLNFEKFWQLAKQVTEFMTWQQVNCPFTADADVLTYLQTNPVYTEEMLAVASFECEPPENNYEKERHKALKTRYQVS